MSGRMGKLSLTRLESCWEEGPTAARMSDAGSFFSPEKKTGKECFAFE